MDKNKRLMGIPADLHVVSDENMENVMDLERSVHRKAVDAGSKSPVNKYGETILPTEAFNENMD